MSLSRRLLVLVVGLVAVALVAADVAGYAALRSLLLSRAHDDLVSATAPLTKLLSSPSGDPKTGGSDLASIHLVDASYQIFDASGTLVRQAPVVRYGKEDLAVPATPSLDRLPINQWPADSTPVKSLVVPSTDGSLEYDIAAYQASDGSTVVIGIPLIDADNTLTLLAQIEAVVSVVVVAVAALASTWLVRLGLRPLARMETTAGEIAGGDLSRRVEPADSRTEVGRLGTALNSMLRRIESAFAAERDSEDRLRRLVADASHELRTPLTAIRGYAELFRRGADRRPEDLARAMRGIESEAERMGRLIDDLLLLARLDEDQPLLTEPVDVADVCRAAVDAARAVEPDRPIDLEADPGWIDGDRERLREVLDNLLANVRVHTPPGSPARVSVRTREDGNVEITVEDSGAGLSEEARTHAFERFYRADASRTRSTGGSGLGLAIVAAIVRAHDGTVTTAQAPSGGAIFEVLLPGRDAPADGQSAESPSNDAAPSTYGAPRAARVGGSGQA